MKSHSPLTAKRATPRRIKPSPPSGLFARLTPEQQETVFTWLAKDGITYRAAVARILEQFGQAVKPNMIWRFWCKACAPRLLKAAPSTAAPIKITLLISPGQPVAMHVEPQGQPA